MVYSLMIGDLKIKRGSRDRFIKAVEEIRRNQPESDIVQYFLHDGMTLSRDEELEYNDYYSVWKGYEEFAKFISPYVEKTDLIFKNDSDERWGYHLDGRGKVCKLYWIQRHTKNPLE